MAIVGTAQLRTVDVAAPEQAWKRHRARLGLTKEEFDGYLDGADQAYLLHLTAICGLDEPLHLHQLRKSGGFQPPQSFRYVAADDPLPLRELAARELPSTSARFAERAGVKTAPVKVSGR